jgi:MinD-like ATPase involved in chromosome partitioning or flagellar assembly
MTVVVAVGSVKGSGGVTATALAVAAATGESSDVVLIESDPSGGSLLGWCPTLSSSAGGLYEAVFDRDCGFDAVRQPLGDVDVVVAQGDPWRISVALDRPRGWRQVLDGLAEVVVVDVGRLYPGSPAMPLAGAADRLVLVAPAEPGPLAATLEWVERGGQYASTDAVLDSGRVRLVTVDVAERHRHRLDPARLGRDELGAGYVAHVPFDDAAIELLCRGASLAHRSLRRSRLPSGVEFGRFQPGVEDWEHRRCRHWLAPCVPEGDT